VSTDRRESRLYRWTYHATRVAFYTLIFVGIAVSILLLTVWG
jgi:hypothetical protein